MTNQIEAPGVKPYAWEIYRPGAGSVDSTTRFTQHEPTADSAKRDGAIVTPLFRASPDQVKRETIEPTDAMARALVAEHRKIWPGGGWPALPEAKRLIRAALDAAAIQPLSAGASVSEPRSGVSMPGKDASRTVPQASHADNRVEATLSDPQQPALRTGVASGPADRTVKRETIEACARVAEECAKLRALIIGLIDNDPSDDAADGVTVLDVWRRQARAALGLPDPNDNRKDR